MNLASEINSELALAISKKFQNASELDRRAALAMLRQIHTTLRLLEQNGGRANGSENLSKLPQIEDRMAASSH